MGVLVIGGTAMALNLGLLTSTAARDQGYRLDVPRPPLSVTLPTTEPSPPGVDSTSVSEDGEDGDADLDDGSDEVSEAERSAADESDDADDGSGDGANSTSDREADDDDDDDDADDDDDDADDVTESTLPPEGDTADRDGSQTAKAGANNGGGRFVGDGSLDDD